MRQGDSITFSFSTHAAFFPHVQTPGAAFIPKTEPLLTFHCEHKQYMYCLPVSNPEETAPHCDVIDGMLYEAVDYTVKLTQGSTKGAGKCSFDSLRSDRGSFIKASLTNTNEEHVSPPRSLDLRVVGLRSTNKPSFCKHN